MSKFTITIEADSLPELADRVLALAAQLNTLGDPVMPEVKASKKAKTTTASVKETPAETAEVSETPATATAETPPSEEPAPQKEPEVKAAEAAASEGPSIRDLTLELVGKGKRDKVEAILAEFGLAKTTAVDEARKQDMINALTDALAG